MSIWNSYGRHTDQSQKKEPVSTWSFKDYALNDFEVNWAVYEGVYDYVHKKWLAESFDIPLYEIATMDSFDVPDDLIKLYQVVVRNYTCTSIEFDVYCEAVVRAEEANSGKEEDIPLVFIVTCILNVKEEVFPVSSIGVDIISSGYIPEGEISGFVNEKIRNILDSSGKI